MIRTLSLIKRRDDLDRETFRRHYEERHVPLARPLLDGLVHYARHHVLRDVRGPIGFDVLTAFVYADAEAASGVLDRVAGEAGAELRADELAFMDKPANTFFQASERLLVAGDEGDEHLFVLVRRPEGVARVEASRRLTRDHWPELIASCREPGYALLRDAFPAAGRALVWDAVLQLRAGAAEGLDRWARGLERQGFGVAAVATRRFETRLSGVEAGA